MEQLVAAWEQRRDVEPQLKGYKIPGWPLAEAA
jgi:hypothetical protein